MVKVDGETAPDHLGPITVDDLDAMGARDALDLRRLEMRRALELLFDDDQIIELRALKVSSSRWRAPHTVSGYYDGEHREQLIEDALRLQTGSTTSKGVYITLQRLNPMLLARRANKAEGCGRGDATTNDHEVVGYGWFILDVDPKRPSGISATPEQHRAALMMGRAIARRLHEEGWPEAVLADSGNGAHVLFRIKLGADDVGLVERALKALSARFSVEGFDVDTTVFNPARIAKLYGSLACKGSHLPEAPHRLARLLHIPHDIELLTREQLVEVVDDGEVITPTARGGKASRGHRDEWDVERWAQQVGLPLGDARDFHSSSGRGRKWKLEPCPCSRSCPDGAALLEAGDGSLSFTCHHNNCSVNSWRDLREMLEPEARDRRLKREERARTPARRAAKPEEYPEEEDLDFDDDDDDLDAASDAEEVGEPDGEEDDWTRKLRKTKKGKVKNNSLNISVILNHDPRWKGLISFDLFSRRVMKRRPPPWHVDEMPDDESLLVGQWTDEDTTALQIWMMREYAFEPGRDRTNNTVIAVARSNSHHPVREYLEGLEWDGKERVERWLVDLCGAEDSEYVSKVGRWWLIGAVARIFEPGCKVDHVMILEGDQGNRKSSAIRTLCKDPDWFFDSPINIGSKDAMQALRGKWIIELAELDAMSKKEAAAIKAFFTSQIDSYRPAYGKFTIEQPRQCVFMGTVNPEGEGGYLKDATGNRRFWPVTIPDKIDLSGLQRERDQIWAEAVELYLRGERWWPEREEQDRLLTPEQNDRRAGDAWEQKVGEWLKPKVKGYFVTTADILDEALDVPPKDQDRGKQTRIGKLMPCFPNWKGERRRFPDGRRLRGWTRIDHPTADDSSDDGDFPL